MVKRVAFAVPGDLATPTGGYAYDRRMIVELARLGWEIDVINLGDGLPASERRRNAKRRTAAADGSPGRPSDRHRWTRLWRAARTCCASSPRDHPLVALVHHPLALESGLSADEAEELRASERAGVWQKRRA